MRRRRSHKDYQWRPDKAFGELHFDEDGRAVLEGKPKMHQELSFTRSYEVWEDEGVLYDSDQGVITVHLRGKPCFLFYLRRRRVETVTFAFHLSANELREAVRYLRASGLNRWIEPGLLYFAKNAPPHATSDPKIKAAVEECLEKTRER